MREGMVLSREYFSTIRASEYAARQLPNPHQEIIDDVAAEAAAESARWDLERAFYDNVSRVREQREFAPRAGVSIIVLTDDTADRRVRATIGHSGPARILLENPEAKPAELPVPTDTGLTDLPLDVRFDITGRTLAVFIGPETETKPKE